MKIPFRDWDDADRDGFVRDVLSGLVVVVIAFAILHKRGKF